MIYLCDEYIVITNTFMAKAKRSDVQQTYLKISSHTPAMNNIRKE